MNRVLWICNIMLPVIGQELNIPYSNREGWLSGIFEKVQKEESKKEQEHHAARASLKSTSCREKGTYFRSGKRL